MEKMEIVNELWPIKEAKRILDKINHTCPEKGFVLFETGYGPSGLPHIGTFSEVVRTRFVQIAFEKLSDIPTKLFVISDDMDSLRKIPSNIQNGEMLQQYIGQPLTSVPDPFGTHQSYGDYMNNRMIEFLDRFGFQYEFVSATKYYQSGVFDKYLNMIANKYQQCMDIMLPTLGEERRETYSPIMPIDPDTNIVVEKGVTSVDHVNSIVHFIGTDGKSKNVPLNGKNCKLQWKVDFGMRWAALNVDYEIYGKDHYPNEKIYRSICSLLESEPPVNFFYEMFLDINGQKISKSKGNGVTVDQWIKYGSIESLSYYMFQKPKTAKTLSIDIIPHMMDEYTKSCINNASSESIDKLQSPVDFIHCIENKSIKASYNQTNETILAEPLLSFKLLLNIIIASNPEDEQVLWSTLTKYNDKLQHGRYANIDRLIVYAFRYYNDYYKHTIKHRAPTQDEIEILNALKQMLKCIDLLDEDAANQAQNIVYKLAKDNHIANNMLFQALYQILLGKDHGPNFGSLFITCGPDKINNLIDRAIDRYICK